MLHDARFMTAQIAANDGAMGFNSMKEPSLKMLNAGNYKKGRLRFYGLEVAIENPAGTYRDTGKKWRLADHYGYIRGFKGADGDDVDCFVGSNVTSKKVYIINQSTADGITFDEHKIMIGYDTPQQAMLAYQLSYDQGWHGLSSIVEVSVKQLRFWLERGSKSKPVIKADLPSGGDYEIPETLVDLMWNGETPSKNIDGLLFAMRRTNAVGEYGNLLLDAATMEDLTAGAQLLPVFDALVSQFSRIKPKMETLQRAMAKKSELADPTADIQISDPFKRYGSLQVSVLFTLTDGQTVSVFFHNPDATPNKILPTDSMVSWKWMLNKKDVTIVVAPEMGKDVPVAEVANRVMQLAQKNAPAFAKSQENKGERVESIKALRAEISELEQKEVELKSEIATFKEINGNEVSSTPIQEQPEVVNTNSEQIQTVKDSDFESFKEDIKKRINSMNIIGVMSPLNKRQKQNHDKNIIKRAKDSDYLKALGISTQTFSQGMPTDNEFKKAFEQKKDFDAKGVKEDNYGQEYIKNKKDQDEELYAGVREIANQKDDTEERKNARKFLDHKGEGEDWDSEPIQPSVKKTSPVAPEPIVITGKELGDFPDTEDGKKALRSAVKNHLMAMRGEWVDCPALTAKVEIRKTGVEKVISSSADIRKLKIMAKIKSLISSASKVKGRSPYNQSDDKSAVAYYILRAVANVSEENVSVRIVIKEDVNGNFHYDATVHDIEAVFDGVKEKGRDESQPFISLLPMAGEQNPSHFASDQLRTSLDNTLDSVNSKMVFNLFIEGEEPEYVESEQEDTPQTAREFIVENAKKGSVFTVANERVTDLMDALMARGWTIYQPYADSVTMQSPTEQTLANIYSKMATDDSLFVEIEGNLDDYSNSKKYAKKASLGALADSYTKIDASNYLENKLGAYVENGIVGDQDWELEPDDHPIEQLYYGKTVEFASSGIALEKAVKDEGGIILWGDYEATLHNQTLFDDTTHYGVTAQIGKDSRVYGRAGIDKDGMVTIYQGASGDTVFGTEQYKPDIEKLVKSLFATKKP